MMDLYMHSRVRQYWMCGAVISRRFVDARNGQSRGHTHTGKNGFFLLYYYYSPEVVVFGGGSEERNSLLDAIRNQLTAARAV